jgi:myo-inositol-1(or 4)-monophosphatase
MTSQSAQLPAHNDLVDLKNAAQQIIAGADQLLLEAFGNVTAIRKSDGSLVTQADHAVDEYITTQLHAIYPDHAVLSEERNTIYAPAVPFTWVIDPLDGTTNFARGVPIWGISVALLFHGLPVIGLLSFISLREQYEAIVGSGALCNGRTIHTDESIKADTQHFLMLCTRTPRRYRIDTPLKPRILGSAAYHIASVAGGNALAAIEATPKLWDIAASLLILTEAGGTYRSLDDRPAIFPLPAERQSYERASFPLIAAASQSILDELEISVVH